MDLAQLAMSIQDQASHEAADYRRATQEMLDAYERQTQRMLAAREQELRDEAQRARAQETMRMAMRAKMRARTEDLAARHALLDEAFARARDALAKMPAAKRTRMLTASWQRAKALGAVRITAARKDARWCARRAPTTAVAGIGGFQARDKTGTMLIDQRWETLLDEVRARKTGEIAEVLFR